MLNFLKPAPAIERLPKEKIPGTYKRYRFQVFMSIYLGYMFYYIVRSNFVLAKPYLVQHGFSNAQIGFVGSALGFSYGISKFVMGNISDRSNPRWFLAIGLIMSGIVNLFMPTTTNIIMLFLLMLINGWFQGMGWPPCAKILSHWFSTKERGVKMSIWNTSHNIGGGLVAVIVNAGIVLFGGYCGVFYFPAILAIIGGIIYILIAKDTPQSVGLPPIEEYRNDYPPVRSDIKDIEAELTGKEILFKYVLNNKLLWCIALANVFIYMVKCGIANWITIYLGSVKGFTLHESSIAFSIFELAAVPGCIIIGWLSDHILNGRRTPIGIICMALVILSAFIYWHSSNFITINCTLACIGAFIYGPVMLIGMTALDISPKKAAGTATGFTGLFGYLGGQVLSEFAIGTIVDKFSWDGSFIALMICSILSIFFLSFTWNVHKVKEKNNNK